MTTTQGRDVVKVSFVVVLLLLLIGSIVVVVVIKLRRVREREEGKQEEGFLSSVSSVSSAAAFEWVSYEEFADAFAESGYLQDYVSASPANLSARGIDDGRLMTMSVDQRLQLARRYYLGGYRAPPERGTAQDLAIRTLTRAADEASRRCFGLLDDIPWRIAVLDDRVDNGFPHTLSRGVICFPVNFVDAAARAVSAAVSNAAAGSVVSKSPVTRAMVETVLHEKVHVYQKARPAEAYAYMRSAYGATRVMKVVDLPPEVRGRWRSNPDLDGYLYHMNDVSTTDNMEVLIMLFPPVTTFSLPGRLSEARLHVFRPSSAASLYKPNDAAIQIEHPLERMAYDVSGTCVRAWH